MKWILGASNQHNPRAAQFHPVVFISIPKGFSREARSWHSLCVPAHGHRQGSSIWSCSVTFCFLYNCIHVTELLKVIEPLSDLLRVFRSYRVPVCLWHCFHSPCPSHALVSHPDTFSLVLSTWAVGAAFPSLSPSELQRLALLHPPSPQLFPARPDSQLTATHAVPKTSSSAMVNHMHWWNLIEAVFSPSPPSAPMGNCSQANHGESQLRCSIWWHWLYVTGPRSCFTWSLFYLWCLHLQIYIYCFCIRAA